jgi:hypothetical protein
MPTYAIPFPREERKQREWQQAIMQQWNEEELLLLYDAGVNACEFSFIPIAF